MLAGKAGSVLNRLRVYVDTSVIGGCEDPEFAAVSRQFFQQARQGRLIILVSAIVVAELTDAPQAVRDVLLSLPPEVVQVQQVTREVLALRDAYLAAAVVGRRWSDDAAHVAVATVSRADAIVSWNFRHMLRLDKMKAYNQVNLLNGYGILTIVSPREVILDEDADSDTI